MPRRRALAASALTAAWWRTLGRLGASQLAERLHVRPSIERVVYEAARLGARMTASHAADGRRAGATATQAPERLHSPKPPGLFDLTPTADQLLIRDAMRRFAGEVLRNAASDADDAASPPVQLLEQAHALGLASLVIPERLGGAATERSSVTNVLIAEELARGDMGLALAALAPVAAVQALVSYATAAQQAQYLPRFLGERFVPAALALLEPRPMFDPMRLQTGAVRGSAGGWALWGKKALVPLAMNAELFVVVAEVRGSGPRLFLVEKGAPGLTVEPEPSMGLRAAALGRLHLENVRLADDAVVGGAEAVNEFKLGDLVDRARIAGGAMAVGTAQAVLDYVVPYVNARHAFGEPIANRQAVAFLVADIAIEVDAMRLMVYRAAARTDRGLDVSSHAALARLQCATQAAKIGSDGVQLLGGHGFIKEHPVERWYRDLRGVGVFEGALLA